jgi:hypothetical protein
MLETIAFLIAYFFVVLCIIGLVRVLALAFDE